MILAVTGWRDHPDREFIWHHLNIMHTKGFTTFRVGDCPTGADKHVRAWCRKHHPHAWDQYFANWDHLGNAASPTRNRNMLLGKKTAATETSFADMCIGFPEPGVHRVKDSGTFGCIKTAVKHGIPVWIPPYRRGTP